MYFFFRAHAFWICCGTSSLLRLLRLASSGTWSATATKTLWTATCGRAWLTWVVSVPSLVWSDFRDHTFYTTLNRISRGGWMMCVSAKCLLLLTIRSAAPIIWTKADWNTQNSAPNARLSPEPQWVAAFCLVATKSKWLCTCFNYYNKLLWYFFPQFFSLWYRVIEFPWYFFDTVQQMLQIRCYGVMLCAYTEVVLWWRAGRQGHHGHLDTAGRLPTGHGGGQRSGGQAQSGAVLEDRQPLPHWRVNCWIFSCNTSLQH